MKILPGRFITLFATILSCGVLPSRAGDTLVQVSTIDALIQGIYDGGVSFGALKKAGDFGIGTLDNLDGEMLALDGNFFQVTSDGVVHEVPDSAETPFSAVTFFRQDQEFPLTASDNFAEMQGMLDSKIGSPNLFYAIRITGVFSSVNLRSVPRQSPPFAPLPEVVKKQAFFNLKNVRGTLVGFRCPPFVKGINVPGYHLHFISEDKKSGGHVLDCSLNEGNASVDVLETFKVLLPDDEAFLKADFSNHDETSVHAVEKPGAISK